MVRHGQASFGEENYDVLSKKGRFQCRILADYFIQTGVAFHKAYTGDLSRQQDTAGEIMESYRGLGLAVPGYKKLSQFNEFSSRDVIAAHIEELEKEDPSLKKHIKALNSDMNSFRLVLEKIALKWISTGKDGDGIYSWSGFRDSVRAGLIHVIEEAEEDENILICTSGGPISVAVQMALDLSDEKTFSVVWHIVNTSVTVFDCKNKKLELKSFNQYAHLELTNQTGMITYL
jgi:broad specificity phosphatase PhoE